MDNLDLVLERGDTLAVDVMTKKIELCHPKEALVWVDYNAMLTKALKHKLDMLQVLFRGGTGNKEVIQIGVAEVKIMKNLVHKSLEGLAGIA